MSPLRGSLNSSLFARINLHECAWKVFLLFTLISELRIVWRLLGKLLLDFLRFSTYQDSAVINQAATNDQSMNMLGVIQVTITYTYDFCEGQL